MITGVDISKEVIFIHVPKVAGHSIGYAIRQPVRSHKTARLCKTNYTEKTWNEAFKFCFIRNPWDHAVSWYNYHYTHIRASMYNCTFEQWIKNGLRNHWETDWCGEEVINDPLNQMLYFQDLEKRDIINFIGAFENLEDDLAYICSQINMSSIEIPKLNGCPHKHYREYYNNDTQKIIYKRYANIIDRFNYEF